MTTTQKTTAELIAWLEQDILSYDSEIAVSEEGSLLRNRLIVQQQRLREVKDRLEALEAENKSLRAFRHDRKLSYLKPHHHAEQGGIVTADEVCHISFDDIPEKLLRLDALEAEVKDLRNTKETMHQFFKISTSMLASRSMTLDQVFRYAMCVLHDIGDEDGYFEPEGYAEYLATKYRYRVLIEKALAESEADK